MKKRKYIVLLIITFIFIFSFSKNNKAKLGIIDSSISKESILKYNIEEYIDYTNLQYLNLSKHGEKVLDIIAKDRNIKIYYCNVEGKDSKIDIEHVIEALDKLKNLNVDVINISLSFVEKDKRLEEKIEECQKQGIVIIAAIDNYNLESYPAGYDNVIAVGNKNASRKYKYLVTPIEYESTSYNTALVTKIILDKRLEDKSVKKIYNYLLKEEF